MWMLCDFKIIILSYIYHILSIFYCIYLFNFNHVHICDISILSSHFV